MLTIHEPPRAFAVQRETPEGGRVKVGLYATIEEAKAAVVRSIERTGTTASNHSIWKAEWTKTPITEWHDEVMRMVADNDPIIHDEDEINDIEGAQE